MMIRFRDLEVPVAVGLLLLSAALGITGWNGQPSNGKEITGGQIGFPDFVFFSFESSCNEDPICLGTQGCGANRWQDECEEGTYEWVPANNVPATNCFDAKNLWLFCAQFIGGPVDFVCATTIVKCEKNKYPTTVNGVPKIIVRCEGVAITEEKVHKSRACFTADF